MHTKYIRQEIVKFNRPFWTPPPRPRTGGPYAAAWIARASNRSCFLPTGIFSIKFIIATF